MTTVVADTHVHIYPFYKVEDALNNIAQNLGQYSGVSHRIACLTERYDCELYAELRDAPRASVIEQFSIKNAKGSLNKKPRNSRSKKLKANSSVICLTVDR